ncbi:MAG: helix-turn-helix domain-containing protein [Psychrobacillus sp.]
MLSAKQLAELLNVSEFTVYRLAKKRKLPCYTVGGQIRFRYDALLPLNQNVLALY